MRPDFLLTYNVSLMPDSAMERPVEEADAGTLRQFNRFARTSGIDIDTMLDVELREIVARAQDEERVPAHAIIDILQICSVLAERPDLGVAFAQWSNMRAYGPLSLLWDHCPTLADAIRINRRYLHLESSALMTPLEQDGDEVAVRHILLIPARYGGSQFIEATIYLSTRVARLILGDGWAPLRIELEHSPPDDFRIQRHLFGCPIEYGSSRSAMIVRQSDLSHVSPNGNAHMLAYLERHMDSMDRSMPADFCGQVEQILAANLTTDHATVDHVSKILGMSRRTLQRRLDEYGTSFGDRLDIVRSRIVEDYFRTERRPNLTLLAHRLGFGDASAASRFLRQRMNTSARELLKKRIAQAPSPITRMPGD